MIRASGIAKRRRQMELLEGVELTVSDGSCYALLGKKGSGKSLLLQILAGILQPDEGEVWIGDCQVTRKNSRKLAGRLGYMEQGGASWPNLRVLEYLEFYASAYGMREIEAKERCQRALEVTGLKKWENKNLELLSESSRRLLCLAKASLLDPEYYLLDQPFQGMDPQARADIEEWIREALSEGKTVLLTSDTLNGIEYLAHEIGVLHEGRLLTQGSVEEVLREARANAPLYLVVNQGAGEAREVLRESRSVRSFSYDENRFLIRFAGNEVQEASLLMQLIEAGVSVRSFSRAENSLENLIFMKLPERRREAEYASSESDLGTRD